MRIRSVKHQGELLVKAFESGIKDVVELDVCDAYEDLIGHLKGKKYFRKLVKSNKGRQFYFFFKKKEDKEIFMEKFYELFKADKASTACSDLGLFLGFPPKACEYFPQKTFGVKVLENIFINYNGMVFASYVETIEDDFKWLFENRPLKKGDFVLIGNISYEVNSVYWMNNIMNDLDLHKKKILTKNQTSIRKSRRIRHERPLIITGKRKLRHN